MMKLSIMWKVDSLKRPDGSSPVANSLLENWEHDPGTIGFFRSSANFVYSFRKGESSFFLRFADGSERRRGAIEAEIDMLNWLAEEKLDVARPVASRRGSFVETIQTEVGTFHGAVFVGLTGRQLEIEELEGSHFREWGSALGELHATIKRYRGRGLTVRSSWRDHLGAAKEYLGENESLLTEWTEVEALLSTLPVNRNNFGLIHFDFELDNLYWQDGRIGMLDFDGCAHYWYAADIAFALRDLFDRGASLDNASFRDFMAGYSSHLQLDETLSAIPLFSRLARLLSYASLARSFDLSPNRDYPDWLLGLIRKIQNKMEVYEASLE
jgi:Ser/Thr protein kinase RdoA (MazF antagonist)